MSTETAKTTEQEQGEWVLAYLSGDGRYYPATRQSPVIVRAGSKSAADLTRAASDHANVLRVEAYPKVVEACQNAATIYDHLSLGTLEAAAKYGPDYMPPSDEDLLALRQQLHTALSAVHPEKDKTWTSQT